MLLDKQPGTGLKLGLVIQIIWITHCPGQAGLTLLIKYLGLTLILYWITCRVIIVCDPDQSKELSMLWFMMMMMEVHLLILLKRKQLITPLFKKGNCNDAVNYRSISLTSVCCKLLESMYYLFKHNISFKWTQHYL